VARNDLFGGYRKGRGGQEWVPRNDVAQEDQIVSGVGQMRLDHWGENAS